MVVYRLLGQKVKFCNAASEVQRPYSVAVESRELLPFRVRLVKDAQDLAKAVEIRSSAFTRHLPQLAGALRAAESEDYRSDVLLLFAERKIDQQPIGSMRLQPNFNRPLRLEGEMTLPPPYRGKRLVETTRVGVTNGNSGKMVTAALVKAAYEICHACGIDYVIAGARRSVAEILRTMCCDDVLGGNPVPISYANGILHWIFALPIQDADRRWRSTEYGFYDFMARTEHPDIDIDYDRVFEVFGTP
jgi:hypothetical protein